MSLCNNILEYTQFGTVGHLAQSIRAIQYQQSTLKIVHIYLIYGLQDTPVNKELSSSDAFLM